MNREYVVGPDRARSSNTPVRSSASSAFICGPSNWSRRIVTGQTRSGCETVGHLHQKAVVRPPAEQIAQVVAERTGAFHRRGVLPALAPDQEQRRARTVLPAEYHVGAELLEVEPDRLDRDRRAVVRAIATLVRMGLRLVDLPQIAVAPLGDEG